MSDFSPEAPTWRLVDDDKTLRVRMLDSEATTRLVNRGTALSIHIARRPFGFLERGATLVEGLTVQSTIRPHETTRPGVYLTRGAQVGEVVVKVAAPQMPPNHELWKALPQFSHPHVLRTLEVFEQDGFYFEIQEFCGGGTLAGRIIRGGVWQNTEQLQMLEKVIVPALWSGLSYLHNQDLIHRDIKPSNLYFRSGLRGEQLVIGDFDISSMLVDDRTSRDTARAAGTWTYAAPEAFPRFMDESGRAGSRISRASDWYSVGVVLLEFLFGTTPLHQADFPDLFDFYLSGRRLEVPVNLPERWRDLVGGLLIRDRQTRWGAEAVSRWISGRTTDDDRRAIRADRGLPRGVGEAMRPFTAFEHSQPTNLEELAYAMLAEPAIAREEMFHSEVLLQWIGENDPKIARQIRIDREKWQGAPDVAILSAVMRCYPATPALITPNRPARDAREWASQAWAAVAAGETDAMALCHPSALLWLEQWLRLKQEPQLHEADLIAQMRIRREAADARGTERPIEDDTAFNVWKAARVMPEPVKGVRSAGYGKARTFVLDNELVTPQDVAEELGVDNVQGRRLCAQLERDGVLQRVNFEQSASEEGLAPESSVDVIFEEICYAFEPNRPYIVGAGRTAMTPSEIARLSYGQNAWGSSPPPIYMASKDRFAKGFLEAYLRQRLPAHGENPNPLVVQIGQVRRQLKEEPYGAFETVLRLLEPKMPPVQVEFSWSSSDVWTLDFNRKASRFLNYNTRGPGVPFGSIEFVGETPNLVLHENLVRARRGHIEARFEAIGDLETRRTFVAQLQFKSHYSRIKEAIPNLEYKAELPIGETLSRIGLGALIGAGVFGLPRVLAMFTGLPRAYGGGDLDINTTFDSTMAMRFPLLSVVFAFVVLGLAAYFAFRVWLWALSNEARS
ncbi:hypothetical protein EON83_12715 [bacterium]|nr:MAG: hypothetical protein EON83_12715 [bacterium]